jgi:hypothetical protein
MEIEKGIKTSEFKGLLLGVAITAAQSLGIDVKEIAALATSPDAQTIIDLVRTAHGTTDSVWGTVAMWGGIIFYGFSRMKRKQSNG